MTIVACRAATTASISLASAHTAGRRYRGLIARSRRDELPQAHAHEGGVLAANAEKLVAPRRRADERLDCEMNVWMISALKLLAHKRQRRRVRAEVLAQPASEERFVGRQNLLDNAPDQSNDPPRRDFSHEPQPGLPVHVCQRRRRAVV